MIILLEIGDKIVQVSDVFLYSLILWVLVYIVTVTENISLRGVMIIFLLILSILFNCALHLILDEMIVPPMKVYREVGGSRVTLMYIWVNLPFVVGAWMTCRGKLSCRDIVASVFRV